LPSSGSSGLTRAVFTPAPRKHLPLPFRRRLVAVKRRIVILAVRGVGRLELLDGGDMVASTVSAKASSVASEAILLKFYLPTISWYLSTGSRKVNCENFASR
jgi:hypothetical protein